MALLDRVLEAIPEGDLKPKDLFTTSGGIVLRVKPVPPLLTDDMRRKFMRNQPLPPKVPNEDKGGVLEENPADPEYIRAMNEFARDFGEATNALLLTRGVEIVSIPNGVEGPDGDGWAEDIESIIDIKVPDPGTRKRDYVWLKYVAIQTPDDLASLQRMVQRASGMTREEDVAEAAESFPDNPPRAATNGVQPSA